MDETGRSPTIAIVEDDRDLASLFAVWLKGCDVRIASDGDEAMSVIDDRIDVVLLDRGLPGRSGDDVLREIRRLDLPCRVAVISGEVPDVDILDLQCERYLVKPVSSGTLRSTVDELLRYESYDPQVREAFALAWKLRVLTEGLDPSYVRSNESYQRARSRLGELLAELDPEIVDGIDLDFGGVFRPVE